MKIFLLFVLLALPASAFALRQPFPKLLVDTPLVRVIRNRVAVDVNYAYMFPEWAAYFEGGIAGYQLTIPYLNFYGMDFVTDRDLQVAEEDRFLVAINLGTLGQLYTTGATCAYYQGEIDALYGVCRIMNYWPGSSGVPVMGTEQP